jgi:predicted RNase H-like HicB family nuclease
MRYQVILEPWEEGFAVSVPGLPGCHSQGANEQEALDNIRDALRDYLDVVKQLGDQQIVREVEVEA